MPRHKIDELEPGLLRSVCLFLLDNIKSPNPTKYTKQIKQCICKKKKNMNVTAKIYLGDYTAFSLVNSIKNINIFQVTLHNTHGFHEQYTIKS